MSDIEKIIDEAIDKAAVEPLIEGVREIAKVAMDTRKKVKEEVEDVRADLKSSIDKLDAKLEKGVGNAIDRVEELLKRSSFQNRLRVEQDDISALKEVIPDRFKSNIGNYEAMNLGVGAGSMLKDEVGAAAIHAWFNLATKLQVRLFDDSRERNQKDFLALNERFNQMAKAALDGQTDAQGGYAVPNIVGNEVLKIVRDASVIYGRSRQVTMTSDTLSLPDEATAVTINWSNTDGTTLTAGEPTFGVKTLNARKLIGRATFSLELLDDSNVAILPFLQSCFAEKMGGELDFQTMLGTGTPFTGVDTATSVGDVARTNGTNGVVLTYNSTASTKASLVAQFVKAGEQSTRNDGIWVCGPSVYAQIIGLVDNNGQPIVRLGTVEGQPNNTLFGRPIVVSARFTNTTIGAGTVSVASLWFGPASALLFGSRQGMRWDVSDQVNWAKYQADARMVGRFGYVVGVPTAWAKQTGIIV